FGNSANQNMAKTQIPRQTKCLGDLRGAEVAFQKTRLAPQRQCGGEVHGNRGLAFTRGRRSYKNRARGPTGTGAQQWRLQVSHGFSPGAGGISQVNRGVLLEIALPVGKESRV